MYEVTGSAYQSVRVAIHPDGQRLAYITDALYVWEDGETQRIPESEQFGEGQSVAMLTWGDTTGVLIDRDELPLVVE